MNCDKYIIMDRGNIIARGMPLETALILLKALFQLIAVLPSEVIMKVSTLIFVIT